MPNSADLVTDLPADFNVFGQGVDTSMQFLLGGTTGQILSKTSATNMAFTWINNDQGDITGVTAGTGLSGGGTSGAVTLAIDSTVATLTGTQTLTNKTLTSPALTTPTISTLTTNGDLLYGTGSGALTRLGIGSSAQVLTVAGGVPSWATPAAGSTFVGALVYRTTNLSLSNATGVIVGWDAESFDTNGFHDNTTNNSRLTVPSGKAGKYLVTCVATYNNNAKGFRSTSFRKNGSTYLNDWTTAPTASGSYAYTITTITLDLVATDYIDVDAYQNSGGALDLRAENYRSYFSMIYLGA